jgi:hypothetical protein
MELNRRAGIRWEFRKHQRRVIQRNHCHVCGEINQLGCHDGDRWRDHRANHGDQHTGIDDQRHEFHGDVTAEHT